ncbi:hypothetical protein BDV19DRAFT_393617 [Aspergillus venezuelensis]
MPSSNGILGWAHYEDVASLLVQAVSPTLQVLPLADMQGANAGVTAVDTAFFEFLNKEYGNAFKKLPFSIKGPGSYLLIILRDQDGNAIRTVNDGLVRFSEKDMKSFYDPVIHAIADLIDRQMRQAKEKAHNVHIINASTLHLNMLKARN